MSNLRNAYVAMSNLVVQTHLRARNWRCKTYEAAPPLAFASLRRHQEWRSGWEHKTAPPQPFPKYGTLMSSYCYHHITSRRSSLSNAQHEGTSRDVIVVAACIFRKSSRVFPESQGALPQPTHPASHAVALVEGAIVYRGSPVPSDMADMFPSVKTK